MICTRLGAEAPHWQINVERHARAQVLGREVGTIYTRSELKHLIGIHVENPEHRNESGLTREDHQMLSGVLDYRVRPALRILLLAGLQGARCPKGYSARLKRMAAHASCRPPWSAGMRLTAARVCAAG